MRIILVLLFISFFSIRNTVGQEKVWLDLNGDATTKEKAVYSRVSSNDKNENKIIVDYYLSGKKAKEFYVIKGKREGKFVEFYSTGEVKTIGEFEDGYREGMWKTYYNNGKMKEKGKYNKAEKIGVWKLYYKNN
jgi:antitoxin component YwqK of YwqJK toxin-antitoxin module